MSYLLDTNILSETLHSKPNMHVVKWLQAIPSDSLSISVLSVGEIRKGIEKLISSKRKEQLIIWLEHELPTWFGTRFLSVTLDVADRWGYISARHKKTLPAIDGLLAATALTYGLKMVTRNTKDFEIPGLEVINPFLFHDI